METHQGSLTSFLFFHFTFFLQSKPLKLMGIFLKNATDEVQLAHDGTRKLAPDHRELDLGSGQI